ncbi:MAG: hypothetical protein E5V74_18665 [Mesorhizobium sp.]|nr:MAG: hypothetical protein E5V86_30305 [Mesorhizobium sp.]TIV97735.1 MAG: hypothetical protein E5V74_18665 [Mesorhizobium sp.]
MSPKVRSGFGTTTCIKQQPKAQHGKSIFDVARFRRVIRKIGSRAAGSSHAGVTILRGIPGGAVRRQACLIHHILVISERLDGAVTL